MVESHQNASRGPLHVAYMVELDTHVTFVAKIPVMLGNVSRAAGEGCGRRRLNAEGKLQVR